MPAFSKVISSRMDDNGSAEDGVLANKLDMAVRDLTLSITLTVSLEVA